jgi:hypothetical protein
MTVTIYYSDGTTAVFSNVEEAPTITDGVVAFKGKRDGDDKAKEWRINWALVRAMSVEGG